MDKGESEPILKSQHSTLELKPSVKKEIAAVGRADMSQVSSRVRESLYELHAHVDFVFRDTISRASNVSSISKKTKFELEKLNLSASKQKKAATQRQQSIVENLARRESAKLFRASSPQQSS